MTKRLYSIGACLQLQVDVRIGDFVAWCVVSHDQKGGIVVGRIQEVMTLPSARRERDAGSGPTVSRPASVTRTNSPSMM